MELIFGAGTIDRQVGDVEDLLREYHDMEKDLGLLYLDYEPVTPNDRVLVEDLAVTMLINSRVAARAATSVNAHGATLDLGSLPRKALEKTTAEEREIIVNVVGTVASWPWLGVRCDENTP